MKASFTTGLAILSSLVPIVVAMALPPQDVPIVCATICGPLVELSDICSPRKASKREIGSVQNTQLWASKLAAGQKIEGGNHNNRRWRAVTSQGETQKEEPLEKRFSIIVAAPTSFPASLLIDISATPKAPNPTPTTPVVQTTQPAKVTPPPQQPPPNPNPAVTRPPGQATTTSRPQKIPSDGNNGMDTNGWAVRGGAEADCVCLNNSFNVSQVAALCSSCVAQQADRQNSTFMASSLVGALPLVMMKKNQLTNRQVCMLSCQYATFRRSSTAQTRIAWFATSASRQSSPRVGQIRAVLLPLDIEGRV